MAKIDVPTYVSPDLHRPGLDPAPRPEPNLFLVHGWWVACCPTCGFQLVEGRSQVKVERKASRATCAVCFEFA
jgi:hypothetical protein